MTLVKWFKDITKNDLAVVGGKGMNLGIMANAQFPVPPGFVITSKAYETFTQETLINEKISEILKKIDYENTQDLQDKAKKIQKLIQDTPISKEIKEAIIDSYEILGLEKKTDAQSIMQGTAEFVAVRSSATAEDLPDASFAGQQETFLNVKDADNVVNAVRACWASLFTSRAIYYRKRNGFKHEDVSIAVVIQRMINSQKSGVLFTINPATNVENEIIIEAAHGLGEVVVSGAVSPDLYIVDKKELTIKLTEVKDQKFKIIRDPETGKNVEITITPEENKLQVLTDREVLEVARIGRKIQDHYQFPQDIEWTIEKGKVYIVQSRPVTTYKKKEEKKEERLRGETASPGKAKGIVRIITNFSDMNKLLKGDVLVTSSLTKEELAGAMQKAVAIVTEKGGMTSHAAIISREIGIPCIVDVKDATTLLQNGKTVEVDATSGTIVFEKQEKIEEKKQEPKKETIKEINGQKMICDDEKGICIPAELAQKQEKQKVQEEVKSEENVKSFPQIHTTLDFSAHTKEIIEKTDVSGVGLLRIELLVAKNKIHPASLVRENKSQEYTIFLEEEFEKVLEHFKDKPVYIRNSDMRTDEYRKLKGGDKEPHETDPVLGWHGIRRHLDEPELFKAELSAIKNIVDKGFSNIGITLPFVTNVLELQKAKEIMKEIGLEPNKDVRLGVMIETPASCMLIEDLCKEQIDFVSFGMSDLTQLTLGIDKLNQKVNKHFLPTSKAVLSLMKNVIDICKKNNVETNICGDDIVSKEMIAFAHEQKVDKISVAPQKIVQAKDIVKSLNP